MSWPFWSYQLSNGTSYRGYYLCSYCRQSLDRLPPLHCSAQGSVDLDRVSARYVAILTELHNETLHLQLLPGLNGMTLDLSTECLQRRRWWSAPPYKAVMLSWLSPSFIVDDQLSNLHYATFYPTFLRRTERPIAAIIYIWLHFVAARTPRSLKQLSL